MAAVALLVSGDDQEQKHLLLSHNFPNALNPELLFNHAGSSCVSVMPLVALSDFIEHNLTCSVITRLYITAHGLTPGEDNDTLQEDETTMEEDNSGLLWMIHGWLSSARRVTKSPLSSQNVAFFHTDFPCFLSRKKWSDILSAANHEWKQK